MIRLTELKANLEQMEIALATDYDYGRAIEREAVPGLASAYAQVVLALLGIEEQERQGAEYERRELWGQSNGR